jgi:hypothetical protein
MIHSVAIQTPDGVGRTLRLTHGAQRRIKDTCGEPKLAGESRLLGLHSFAFVSQNLVEIAYCMLEHVDGKPPADLSIEGMREMYGPDDPELFGAVSEALTQGEKKKEQMIVEFNQMKAALMSAITGKTPGPSLVPPSDSPDPRPRRSSSKVNSGTSTPKNSLPSLSNTTAVNA